MVVHVQPLSGEKRAIKAGADASPSARPTDRNLRPGQAAQLEAGLELSPFQRLPGTEHA